MPKNAVGKDNECLQRGLIVKQPPGLAKTLQMESTADLAPLPCADSVQTRGGGGFSVLRIVRAVLKSYLDAFLGVVLLLAGALKGHQLLTDPSAGRELGFPRELLLGATAFELAFGCWMLAGLYRHRTRWIALCWFTSLAAAALAQAVGGAATCACLGGLHASPWLMLAFDVAAAAALWIWSPSGASTPQHWPMILFLSLVPAAALLCLASIPHGQPMFAEIDLGDIARGGQKQQSFQIGNDSGALVEISSIETSCPCASIHLERTSISAGEDLAGSVTLNLRLKPKFAGDVTIHVMGLTRRGRVAFVLVVRGCVHSEPYAAPGNLCDIGGAS